MRWDRGPESFIPLDLGCQQRPSLCACVYASLSALYLYPHTAYACICTVYVWSHTQLKSYQQQYPPVPNPKVCRWDLSHSESGVGPDVWLKLVYLGPRGWRLHHYCLASSHKGSGDALSGANVWDTLLLWKPIPKVGRQTCQKHHTRIVGLNIKIYYVHTLTENIETHCPCKLRGTSDGITSSLQLAWIQVT